MIRLSVACIVAAIVAGVVAWRLGGTLGMGVLAGFLLGAGVSGLGSLYQRHVLVYRPERLMQAVMLSFLGKLVFLLMGALTFRFVEAAAARADWRSFLLAFATAIVVVLPFGALDAARLVRPRAGHLDPEKIL